MECRHYDISWAWLPSPVKRDETSTESFCISSTDLLHLNPQFAALSQLHAHVKSSAAPSKSRTTSSCSPSNRRDAGGEVILPPAALLVPARRSPLPTSTQNRSQPHRRWSEARAAARCRPPHLRASAAGATTRPRPALEAPGRCSNLQERAHRGWKGETQQRQEIVSGGDEDGWDAILSFPQNILAPFTLRWSLEIEITYKSFWREKG
jgi:hypothetical protein